MRLIPGKSDELPSLLFPLFLSHYTGMPHPYYKAWLEELPDVVKGWSATQEHAISVFTQGRIRIDHYHKHGIDVWTLTPDGTTHGWFRPETGCTLAATVKAAQDSLGTEQTQ